MNNEIEEQLKGMSKEEINELIKKQCLFCNISNKNIESYKVYDDNKVMAVLDINPANKGHTIVFPKQHFQFLNDLNNELTGHVFDVVNKISSKMINELKASGVNVYVANGVGAGQSLPHICVHVIPRFKDDKIVFTWNPKKMNKNEFEEVANKIKVEIEKKEEVKKIKPTVIKASKHYERIP